MQSATKQAEFRFYAELNDFLDPERRYRTFACTFFGEQTVKHLIESLGVPHTEVDLILINGRSAGFSDRVAHGDRVSVYPVFEAFDISQLSQVRPQPLRRTRFVADVHLGRLAGYLRMLGFDTWYARDTRDQELAQVAAAERRILLTRDRELLHRHQLTHGYYVRSPESREQVLEVLRRFDLARSVRPFSRCIRCNHLLEAVAKQAVWDAIPPRSRDCCEEFRRCPGCGRLYWSGSHHRRMQAWIEDLVCKAQIPMAPPMQGRRPAANTDTARRGETSGAPRAQEP